MLTDAQLEFAQDLAQRPITDQADYDLAASTLRAVKVALIEKEADYDLAIRDAQQQLDWARGSRKKATEGLRKAEEDLKHAMETYQTTEREEGREVQRAASTTARELWSAKVVDAGALLRWVAQDESGERLGRYVKWNLAALDQVARERKERGEVLPGVVASSKISIAASGR